MVYAIFSLAPRYTCNIYAQFFFLAEEDANVVATSEIVDKEQIKTQSNGDTGEFYIEIILLLNNC